MNGSDIKCPLACSTFYSVPEMGPGSSSSFAAGLLLLGAVILAEGEKLLVVPADGSHWLSMKPVVEKIGSHGHQVVVLSPDGSLSMTNSSLYTLKYYSVKYSSQYVKASIQKFGGSHFNRPPFPGLAITMFNLMMDVYYLFHSMCSTLLNNRELMEDLREEKFDAVLTDSFVLCGVILAEYLDVPAVNFLRGMPCSLDFSSAQCPNPLSYVPRFFSKLTDKMTFTQRLENILMWLIEHYYCAVQYAPWVQLASEFLKKEVNIVQLLSRISIWLLRYDFVFDYPKPIMPNMVFVGGINCKPKKPMDKEFEKLVNSSGEHGFVVFSFGSMISEIPTDKAMAIAKALGSIPQKVIWRYTGTVPSNLAENTHLVKWLPQNDLLAHPKARAFITHAGSHGIYEAICNAVPVVMLPLFSDQMDNAVRIESRGAGVTLNVLDMTSEDLSNALKTVIEDPSYKKNIEHLSALHLDRPIHPLDLAVYWVEFVMRHKGAPHLRPAAHELNFFQYHSLDIIGFLLLVMIATLFISLKCCCFAFRRCCGKRPSRPQSKTKSKSKPE